MSDELMAAQSALSSAFIDDAMFIHSFGGPPNDLGAVGRYLRTLVAERPAPSIYFDRDFYLAANPDVAREGVDPLLHFLTAGCAERRSPHPMIDLAFIDANESVSSEPRALADLLDRDRADPSPYFDRTYYRAELGAVIVPRGLLRHFLATGLAAGRNPNEHLDIGWYVANNEDLPRDLHAALRHFVMHGDPEGRQPGPTFDGRLYLARYPDVAEGGFPPLRHFREKGRHEGRHAAVDATDPRLAAAAAAPSHQVQRLFETLRERLAERRRLRKFTNYPAPPAVPVRDPARLLAEFAAPSGRRPRVSVLIPVLDEPSLTAACLMSLIETRSACAFEVVVADDGSTDPAIAGLSDAANLVIVRQAKPVGFIRNCNAAFRRCSGEYVLLLNNDTRLMEDALNRLVDALDADPSIAAAGPKLIFPDGKLQEAGCALRPNGESVMVGLFRDPDEPGFTRDRDVAYCSAAALLVRRAAIRDDLGDVLFDESYLPAYCEDADLCLRLTEAGHRIRYVAGAVVVHHLSMTTNRQPRARKLRGVAANQERLAARWGETLRRRDAVRVIAFYLPQFHRTAENDLWWGAGFTEWSNVAKARPSYVGHYQPHLPTDLGFYDLSSVEAMRRQAELAARYGVDGFCIYYYNFGHRRVLSKPLALLRGNPDIAVSFCLCWANENWTRRWDGGAHDILLEQDYDAATLRSVIADAVDHARDPRALRVEGKPMFLVYRAFDLPDPAAFAADCRAAFAAAGFPGAHLAYVEGSEAADRRLRPDDLGFDACVEFPPQGRAVPAISTVEVLKPDWSGYRYDYPETVLSFVDRDSPSYVRYPGVFPSWDNTARQPLRGTSFDDSSPEAFRFFVEEKLDEARQFHQGDERLLFVNAWNEWAEGAHLEPDGEYGHGWLEALRAARDTRRFA